MKNGNDAILGDLEGGVRPAGTATSNSLSLRRKNTSASATFAAAPKFKKLISTVHESEFSRIFQCLNLTRTPTQQKALLLLCVAAAIIDPLFFYIPMINEGAKCMKSDWKIGAFAISTRSVVDVLHFVLWSFYYERKWKAWRPPKLGASAGAAPAAASKEVSPCSPSSLSPRNSKATGRLIEILSILPLPQAATLAILIIKGNPRSQQVVTLLKFSVLVQFILRIFRVFPSFHEATTNSITLLKSRFWIGAGFNLLLFVIASHVLGAFWYLLSVGRMMDCWKGACRSRVGCNIDSLYCGGLTDNKSYLDDFCGPLISAYFQYRTNEDLENMKGKMDKIMKKQRDLSNWQPFQWLPQILKEEVISCVEDNWLETTEVDLQTMLDYLPKDLRRKIKLTIFSQLQMKVSVGDPGVGTKPVMRKNDNRSRTRYDRTLLLHLQNLSSTSELVQK